jgi:plastocyanin
MRSWFLLAAALLAGCAGSTASPAGVPPATGPAAQSIGFSDDGVLSISRIGVRLTGENSFTDPTYGKVLGYFPGLTSTTSGVVTVALGSKVTFSNVDTSHPHTASFLGDASGSGASWPSSFTGSSSQSPAGTDISTSNFSTGTLSAGKSSLIYSANVPGFYMIGCAFHYTSFGMRDVVIVQ